MLVTSNTDQEKPMHPGLTHTISRSAFCEFPDGGSAALIVLGDKCDLAVPMGKPEVWWPTAPSASARSRLIQRFIHEGYLLPRIVALCFSLLAEMYTTTSGQGKRRVRLKYSSSPIADFGIVKGRVEVEDHDRFAYYNPSTNTFAYGQDPEDHYWIYFSSLCGDEVVLDCGMSPFNFSVGVHQLKAYLKHGLPANLETAPALFVSRDARRTEQQRFSVLRDPELGSAVLTTNEGLRNQDVAAIHAFMDRVAGRVCTPAEKDIAKRWSVHFCEILQGNIRAREYLNFPVEVATGLFGAQEERKAPEARREWMEYMVGEGITTEQLEQAFKRYEDAPHRVRERL
ncbi:hypothetical protein CC2G_012605 [Coprinopsis cinerea AmutBmut pab1-1]|nr:hypothetical protein CC2G_012605 [Coprinopsis cinerea AmutBmut pab1-1]